MNNQRLLALDILRGFTICGMILVNNPGGGEENAYAPLLHAEWFGLTPTDLVFPFFMFIMGVTTYLSLRKFDFEWSASCARKILKRSLLLWFTGLAITWSIMFTRGMISENNASLGLMERMLVSANVFDHIRILGVMPRLGICYGIAACVTLSVRHKFLPWLIAGIFIVYYAILAAFNGFAHDATNVIAVIDDLVMGHSHVYRAESPDPEGLLSTLPSIAHVLIGVCVGRIIMRVDNLNEKIERLFVVGAVLTFCGLLLSYGCPLSKKLWTPTFSLVTCGFASTLLALLVVVIDKYRHNDWALDFLKVFGVNPLALFVISDVLLIPCSILPVINGRTLQDACYNACCGFLPNEAASLCWTVSYILLNWCIGYYLYKKKIIISL